MNIGFYLEKKKGTDVYSINVNQKVSECINMLNDKKVGALIVLDDNNTLQGIVSERDILRQGCSCEGSGKNVSAIMTPKSKLITADRSENISDIMKKLDENKVRHIPIMDGEKVIGVVSITDIITELRQMDLFENEQLKNYILSPY